MYDREKARLKRIEIFEDTLKRCEEDPYLKQAVHDAKKTTWVYLADDYPLCGPSRQFETEITVTKHRTFEAAEALKAADPTAKIAVLNFANAFHPGGGVTAGAGAQEECLCRCSTLYPVLHCRYPMVNFYGLHRQIGDPRATDAVIYTEGVVVFKSDTPEPAIRDRGEWFTVDVMTCAAPDLRTKPNRYVPLENGGSEMDREELLACHIRRTAHLLTAAAARGADTLVLGAFGCGAFQNDAGVVAEAFRTALEGFRGRFRKVEFAVHCSPRSDENYRAFAEAFR